jgi:hypothetical protein
VKKYDVKKVKAFIEANKERIKSVALGMYEDWFWTAEDVFENGAFRRELIEGILIGGINGSRWGTPSMLVEYTDGTNEMIECYTGESEASQPSFFTFGVLSGPCQSNLPALSKETT